MKQGYCEVRGDKMFAALTHDGDMVELTLGGIGRVQAINFTIIHNHLVDIALAAQSLRGSTDRLKELSGKGLNK